MIAFLLLVLEVLATGVGIMALLAEEWGMATALFVLFLGLKIERIYQEVREQHRVPDEINCRIEAPADDFARAVLGQLDQANRGRAS